MSHECARATGIITGRTRYLQANRDVFNCGLPGKQGVGLEQVPRLAVQRGKLTAKNIDPAGGWCEQPGSDIQQRGFAAPGWADDGDEFAVGHMECRAFNRRIDATTRKAKGDHHAVERDRRA